jgi:hypothetical protein
MVVIVSVLLLLVYILVTDGSFVKVSKGTG